MRALRWIGIVVGTLVALVLVTVGVVYALTERRIARHYEVTGRDVPTPEDSATIARGEHVATVRGCSECHAQGLKGQTFIDAPAVARLHAPNLTRGAGGAGARYVSTSDWERAIRHGVDPSGRALIFMPAHEFYPLSDDDLGALISYIRNLPPVDHVQPGQSVGPVGRGLFIAGLLPLVPAELIDHEALRPTAPAVGVTVEYGAYLATTCTGCHGMTLSGGPIPGAPPEMATPRNITPDSATGIGKWALADFTRAVREGRRPDGTPLSKDMPSQLFQHFSDDEVAALWSYLRTVPAKAYGGRVGG
jgi:cytochrome c553